MKHKIFAFFLGLMLCFSIQAQTNNPLSYLHALRVANASPTNYYNAAETVVELAPTISSSAISDIKKNGYTIGYSLETEHWTSQYLGTGLEIGTYDYRTSTIDHIAIMEDVRYVPFESDTFWRRLAIGGKTGAETYFTDGSKDIEFGGELYFQAFKNVRFEADILQHERTTSSKDGQTARFAIQWLF